MILRWFRARRIRKLETRLKVLDAQYELETVSYRGQYPIIVSDLVRDRIETRSELEYLRGRDA